MSSACPSVSGFLAWSLDLRGFSATVSRSSWPSHPWAASFRSAGTLARAGGNGLPWSGSKQVPQRHVSLGWESCSTDRAAAKQTSQTRSPSDCGPSGLSIDLADPEEWFPDWAELPRTAAAGPSLCPFHWDSERCSLATAPCLSGSGSRSESSGLASWQTGRSSPRSVRRTPCRWRIARRSSPDSSRRKPCRWRIARRSSPGSSRRTPCRWRIARRSSPGSSRRKPCRWRIARRSSPDSSRRTPCRWRIARRSSPDSSRRKPCRWRIARRSSPDSSRRTPCRCHRIARRSSPDSSRRTPCRCHRIARRSGPERFCPS